MSIPVWVLLGFAAWTLLTLLGGVGVYRWRAILSGRTAIGYWRADREQGDERYRRAVRAHLNCVENLPVYTALVVVLLAAEVSGPLVDALAVVLLVARIAQTLVHVLGPPGDGAAAARFALFFLQLLCMFALGALVVMRA